MSINEENIIDIKRIDPQNILKGLNDMKDYFLLQYTKKAWDSMLNEKYANAVALSQILLDRTWEHLNTGYWKDVDIRWRYLYSFSALMKSYSLYELGNYGASINSCDMGLLMGAPIFENILSDLASKLAKIIQENSKQKHKGEDEEPIIKKQKLNGVNNSPVQIQDLILNKYKINKIEPPSLITFQGKHMLSEIPVVIRNGFNHWPAMKEHRWTIEYLKSIAGARTVPIEIGDKYTSDNWTQKLITLNEFIDTYIETNISLGYLAQHQLFEQIPELKNDIMVPDYCYLSTTEEDSEDVLIHAWYGPQGTVSPLHHDPYHNLLSQVVGSKYIRLYDRRLSQYVYPNKDSMLDNTSQVDVENVDVLNYPKFVEAPYFECILKEGEMLYIPPKWWHYVKSLSTSFSVSFWWK